MEVSQVAVRTRARAMAMVAEETADNSAPAKRRKVGNEKLRSPSTLVQTESVDREINVNSALEEGPCASCEASASLRSGGVPASCWSSTGSDEKLKVADLADEESVENENETETETAASARYNLEEISESTRTREESGELESTTKQSSITSHSVMKMPDEAELEEFFAVAQEGLNKGFKDKYNYDIVKDIPLKGRYEWIRSTKAGKMTTDG